MADRPCEPRRDLDPLLEAMHEQLRADYAVPHVKRDAHPKMHGLVQAVLDVDVDPSERDALACGIFDGSRTSYAAWVRFSNAFGIQHDLLFEARGMAIKVLDVDPSDPSQHQDFLLATHDAFFLPNTRHYREFFRAAHTGPAAVVWFFVRHGLFRGFAAFVRSAVTLAMNPLAITYSSQSAFRLGPRIVKVRARPRMTPELQRALPRASVFRLKSIAANLAMGGMTALRGPEAAEAWCERFFAARDCLRLAMMSFLAAHDALFDLEVQVWPANLRLTDDPTRTWCEEIAPYHRVAVLRIPRQVFWPVAGMPPAVELAAEQLVDLGEDMSFSPWHTLRAHEPVGEINQARCRIYRDIATFRHDKNRVADPVARLSGEYKRLSALVRLDREPV